MGRLAFYTFGIMQHPEEMGVDVSELQIQIPRVFEDAADAPGYLEPVLAPNVEKPMPRFFDSDIHYDALVILSIWRDIESVYAFSYRGRHADALRNRHSWFVKGKWPSYVGWWIGDGQTPTFADGVERLERLNDHGSTAFAFSFREPFDSNGCPYDI